MRSRWLCEDMTACLSAGLEGMTMITEVAVRQQVWAGVDAGKSDHHCVAIDVEGQRLLSQRVANDETALLELIDAVSALADGGEVTWAIGLNAGGAALLITLLIAASSGCSTFQAAPSTTPRPATAATARATPKTPPSSPTKLGCAATCSHCDRRRYRGRAAHPDRSARRSGRRSHTGDQPAACQLLEYFPALERAFDYGSSKAALTC